MQEHTYIYVGYDECSMMSIAHRNEQSYSTWVIADLYEHPIANKDDHPTYAYLTHASRGGSVLQLILSTPTRCVTLDASHIL